jgi:hypothetical protein
MLRLGSTLMEKGEMSMLICMHAWDKRELKAPKRPIDQLKSDVG